MDKRQEHAINERVSDRTPRPLMAPLLGFDLLREAEILESEPAWSAHGHNARTLIKHSEFRLVLVVLARAARMKQHQSSQRVAVQTLRGRVRLHVCDDPVELCEDQLLALDRDLTHDIEALQDSVLLLWVGWSKD